MIFSSLLGRFVTALDIKEVQFVWHFTEQHNFTRSNPYILKAGFAGFQNPHTIWNFPQKDCLRTRKLSILWWPRGFGSRAIAAIHSWTYPAIILVIINTRLDLFWHFIFEWCISWTFAWFTHFCSKKLSSRFPHFSADFLRLKSRIRRLFHF